MSFGNTAVPGLAIAAARAAGLGGDKKDPKPAKNTRVQMELPPSSFERLTALKDRTEAVSYSEVMKDALRLYEFFLNQPEGAKFFIQAPDAEQPTQVVLFT